MRIDVHAHYLPAAYTGCLERLGHPDAGPAIARMPGGAVTLDEHLAAIDAVGLDRQVLSVGPLQPQLPDAAAAAEAASLVNDLYAELCQQYPARFAAFAALPLPHVDAALAEIERVLGQPGMLDKVFKDFHAVLKPGGVLAVEEHRSDPTRAQVEGASDGYVDTAFVVATAEKAGFKLAAKSEINANPKDTKDHPYGVWTLPPTRQSSAGGEGGNTVDPKFDRAKYDAIGESDRMTLRFVKPKK